MKLNHRLFPALLIAAGILHSQEPEPVCGLPHITQIPAEEPVTIYKRLVPTENPTFLIREHYTSNNLIEVEFYLKRSDFDFEVYVEAAEWDSGHVDAAAIDTLVTYFRDRTLPGSINPNLGIKANAEYVFGSPPDIDNNDKVYILLIDVRDDYVPDSSETYVAGYFDPLDQEGYAGNRADIIYLDTNPGTLSGDHILPQIGTLAHEYQHLIHYRHDSNEETWVNEGLSELSPVLMGLPHREFTSYLTNTNVRLDSFGQELADYARCGLFFLYTWVQLGTQFIRELIVETENGTSGFNLTLSAYNPSSMDGFVLDWHVANFIQGEGAYGYGDLFSIPQPVMHEVITTFPQEDFPGSVVRLGAQWILITGGRNLYMRASRTDIDPRLTLLNGNDRTIIAAPQLFAAGYYDSTFGTAYNDLVVLATASTAVSSSAAYSLYVDAQGGYEEKTLSYDGNEDPMELLFITLGDALGNEGEAAVAFDIVSDKGELSAVQFYTLTSDSVRVRVYHQALSPDSVIHTALVSAPLATDWTTHRLPRGLQEGNQRVFVSVAGVDNALAYNDNDTISHYSYYRFPENTSFTRLDSLKVAFPSGEEKILVGNWSVRLSYLLLDTSEDEIRIPVFAGQFYPNPFNPITHIDISPGYAVELILYNILGQEVFRLKQPAGLSTRLTWNGIMDDGRLAPSGVYLARVVVGGTVVNRKIVLIR